MAWFYPASLLAARVLSPVISKARPVIQNIARNFGSKGKPGAQSGTKNNSTNGAEKKAGQQERIQKRQERSQQRKEEKQEQREERKESAEKRREGHKERKENHNQNQEEPATIRKNPQRQEAEKARESANKVEQKPAEAPQEPKLDQLVPKEPKYIKTKTDAAKAAVLATGAVVVGQDIVEGLLADNSEEQTTEEKPPVPTVQETLEGLRREQQETTDTNAGEAHPTTVETEQQTSDTEADNAGASHVSPSAEESAKAVNGYGQAITSETDSRGRDPLQILLDSGGHGVSLQGNMVKDLQQALAMSDLGLWSMMLYHKDGEPRVVDGMAGSRTYAAVLAYAEDHQIDLRSMTMAGLIQHAKAYEDPENRRMLDSQPGSSTRTSAESGKNQWDNGHTASMFNTQVAAEKTKPQPVDTAASDMKAWQTLSRLE